MWTLIMWTWAAGVVFAITDYFCIKELKSRMKKRDFSAFRKYSLGRALLGWIPYVVWVVIGVYLVRVLATDEVVTWTNVEGAAIYFVGTYVARAIAGHLMGNYNFNIKE